MLSGITNWLQYLKDAIRYFMYWESTILVFKVVPYLGADATQKGKKFLTGLPKEVFTYLYIKSLTLAPLSIQYRRSSPDASE